MNSVNAGIARRLCLAREGARLNKKDAAAELGVSRQRLARIESGESSAIAEEVLAMCLLYGVTPNYVLIGQHGVARDIAKAMSAASAAGAAR